MADFMCSHCKNAYATMKAYEDHYCSYWVDHKQTGLDDPVNHPSHYTSHPSGIECIQITEHMGFNIGNAMKYLWRADLKNGLEDLKKAEWYVKREIERRGKDSNSR